LVCNYLQSLELTGVVVTYGDTLSAMAAGMAGKATGWKVAHVEAGLRSNDMTMPEEVSRIALDGVADRMYTPTPLQYQFLRDEGVPANRIILSGNVIVDAVKKFPVTGKEGNNHVLLTLHRPENVDVQDMLLKVLEFCEMLRIVSGCDRILYPVHPRSRERVVKALSRLGFSSSVDLIEPVVHSRMLQEVQDAKIVITDSGGLQEECAVLKRKCITVRKSTERQETIAAGWNVLVSPYTETVTMMLIKAQEHLANKKTEHVDYGYEPSRVIASDLEQWDTWETFK